ncbi:Protein DOWNY MILDEW RESISTANCE 6 [Camellia lanceoleosa]|uniref:Protein DOWNY MILDEW RESISTANCE 6 n=1 Tax=Camellia lanceoleosa TaxID=1840588 RepID=A0ACC0F3Z4_9ERIC|nr:Protein DOWNY MILDEW RESISTANCE 6 [Camellia lanceoleosa]KAI7983047.1 Protein DOWNY MILDEW RESISTANCE 6 [Camellia lanceoleosa]
MAEARDRNSIIKKVLNASQEFGFFQVINHGVSENLMDDAMDLFKEFFDMPADDKASVYSDDPSQSCRLFTSSYNYFGGIISDTLVILQRNAFNRGLKSQLDIERLLEDIQ